MSKPLAIDLFCGLGGWTEGLLSEGYDVIGFDIEAHEYGEEKYPGKLVLQDVLTLHGSQFKDAALIVASPPCQEFSYMAMPWSRAKAKAAAIRADSTGAELARLTALFDACFRIQREAIAAAGRHIPLVVENVKGAQPWVGRAKWSFGSYYLWGDVPALMPLAIKAVKVPGMDWSKYGEPGYKAVAFNDEAIRQMGGTKNAGGSWFNVAHNTTCGVGNDPDGRKNPGFRFDGRGKSFQSESVKRHVANIGGPQHEASGIKQGGSWFHDNQSASRKHSSKSPARKAASAKIAKIPFALSSWIARTYKPVDTTSRISYIDRIGR